MAISIMEKVVVRFTLFLNRKQLHYVDILNSYTNQRT